MSEYISREELIDRLSKTELSADQIRMLVYPREAVTRAIYDCSSADVRENIHGHWKEDNGYGLSKALNCSRLRLPYRCSICGSGGLKFWNFCRDCGADMREPKGEKGEI